MQTVDLTQVISDESGKPMKINLEDGVQKEMTLGAVCILCLKVPDDKLTMDDKVRRGELAIRLYGQDKVDLELADVSLLLDLVGKYHNSPLAVTRVKHMLDGPVKPFEVVKD